MRCIDVKRSTPIRGIIEMPIEFLRPLVLLLLPLALLPLLPNRRDVQAFPWLGWIPVDPLGARLHKLWLTLAVLTLAVLLAGLAAPMGNAGVVERIGRGAEISILLDRSASMDSFVRRKIEKDYQAKQKTQSKNDIARIALSWLLRQRPENRYSLTLFHVTPMSVAQFTSDTRLLQSVLDASAIGRGAKETNMGAALLSAIQAFDQRPYTGSRVLLLVSDGGARLDPETREKIRVGLQENKISLYFIYVKSGINNANFEEAETIGTRADKISDEIALHLFFKALGTPYQVFEADDEVSMGEAVAAIDSQHNQPLTYYERIPGQDLSQFFFITALLGCACLALLAWFRPGLST